jgi:hypothetical protein
MRVQALALPTTAQLQTRTMLLTLVECSCDGLFSILYVINHNVNFLRYENEEKHEKILLGYTICCVNFEFEWILVTPI